MNTNELRAVVLSLCCVFSFSFASGSELKYDEIRAGYEQNILSLGNFGVVVHTTSSATVEHVEVLKARISRLTGKLAECPADVRPRLEKRISQLRNDISSLLGSNPQSSILDHTQIASLVVSNSTLQVVVSPKGGAVISPERFPRTQVELFNNFSDHVLLSWSSNQSPNSWLWQGSTRGTEHDRMYGGLSDKHPRATLDFPVPPLGKGLNSIDSSQCSILDKPFRGQYDDTNVVGHDDIGGASTVLIECKSSDQRGVSYCTKSWVDTSRGYVPVRMELSLMPPATIGNSEVRYSEPYMIVTTSDIKQVGDHSYYPVSWKIESRQDDDRSPDARPPLRVKPAPLYTYQIETWKISSISPNLPNPVLLSEIGFPKGTYCFDETKNAYFTVGSVEAAVDATIKSVPKVVSDLPGPPKVLKPASTRWKLFLLVNVLVTVGLAAFATVRLYRRNLRERGAK